MIFLAWSRVPSGEFTVHSAYKLLQGNEIDPKAYALQTDYRNFYKNLWLLNLSSKIKIIVWRISWNYLPTMTTSLHKRLLHNALCSGCGRAAETTNHLCRECPGFLNRTLLRGVGSFAALFGQSDKFVKINFDAAYDRNLR